MTEPIILETSSTEKLGGIFASVIMSNDERQMHFNMMQQTAASQSRSFVVGGITSGYIQKKDLAAAIFFVKICIESIKKSGGASVEVIISPPFNSIAYIMTKEENRWENFLDFKEADLPRKEQNLITLNTKNLDCWEGLLQHLSYRATKSMSP